MASWFPRATWPPRQVTPSNCSRPATICARWARKPARTPSGTIARARLFRATKITTAACFNQRAPPARRWNQVIVGVAVALAPKPPKKRRAGPRVHVQGERRDIRLSAFGAHINGEARRRIHNMEIGSAMKTREQPPAKLHQQRAICLAAPDESAVAPALPRAVANRHTVRYALRRQTEKGRHARGTKLLEPNQANTDHCVAVHGREFKGTGNVPADCCRVSPEVQQHPSSDHAFQRR